MSGWWGSGGVVSRGGREGPVLWGAGLGQGRVSPGRRGAGPGPGGRGVVRAAQWRPALRCPRVAFGGTRLELMGARPAFEGAGAVPASEAV